MYVYVGKLDWLEYAQNECITIVFPAGFALNDPVCAYWQWTVDGAGVEKRNSTQNGFITSVTKATSEYSVRFPFDYYAFEGTVSADFSSLSLQMSDPQGATKPVSLSLQLDDGVRIPSTSVFTGKLDWLQYSKNEMVTLVIPGTVANGGSVILSYQWTVDGEGIAKANHTVRADMKVDGDEVSFSDGFYTYSFRAPKIGDDLVLSMTDPSGQHDSSAPYTLNQTDFRDLRKKKALIVRFRTGTDDGIFLVQKMLINHLGFADHDVELSYFDVDPDQGPKQCTKGQDPPTATNFKSKFTQLCKSAVAGDVRFLYVDTHGTAYPDPDGSGEVDDYDEGWTLAGNDDGTKREIVYDDWLAEAIQKNLAKGVNLTILTSSCMGGGMLDTHTATPGILLAGCHETQFNVKALNHMDPWMVGVVRVISNNIRRKRGVPTYSTLYNEAKKFIRAQILSGAIRPSKYQGPSPDELQPIPRDEVTFTSYQDPQLVFYSGYIDPGQERFLVPFGGPSGGQAGGDATRFPKDEYPHDEL